MIIIHPHRFLYVFIIIYFFCSSGHVFCPCFDIYLRLILFKNEVEWMELSLLLFCSDLPRWKRRNVSSGGAGAHMVSEARWQRPGVSHWVPQDGSGWEERRRSSGPAPLLQQGHGGAHGTALHPFGSEVSSVREAPERFWAAAPPHALTRCSSRLCRVPERRWPAGSSERPVPPPAPSLPAAPARPRLRAAAPSLRRRRRKMVSEAGPVRRHPPPSAPGPLRWARGPRPGQRGAGAGGAPRPWAGPGSALRCDSGSLRAGGRGEAAWVRGMAAGARGTEGLQRSVPQLAGPRTDRALLGLGGRTAARSAPAGAGGLQPMHR